MTSLVKIGSAVIQARSLWNRTGIVLSPGDQYLFTAQGRWVDFFLPHGPAGNPSQLAYMRWFERYRRIPKANWFALIGALDCNLKTAFVIGQGSNMTAEHSGELTCFANDVSCMYWNNWGHVELFVQRYVPKV